MKTNNHIAFVNGTVLTVDAADTVADSVYVCGNQIRAVGTAAEIQQKIPETTKIIDIAGKTLVPGFIDAHNHLCFQGAALGAVKFNFPDVASIDDLKRAVQEAAGHAQEGRWIRGWGMDYGKFPEGRLPTRWDIDDVAGDHPVCIVHVSGHYVLVNSIALKMAGVSDDTPDPQGGKFIRDTKNRITGLAMDAAQQMVIPTSVNVMHHGPDIGYDAPLEEIVEDIERGAQAYLAAGITSIVDPQVTTREMPAYIEAYRSGKLAVKATCMYLSNHLEAVKELGLTGPIGDGFLSTGPIKFYCDGSIIGGTAYFYESLKNSPGDHGYTYWNEAQLKAALIETHRLGLQFGIHTQGDQAMDIVLDAVAEARRIDPRTDPRHRIEHCHGPTSQQIERIAELGMIPITQPGQIYEAGDDLISNYGHDRARRFCPLRSMLDAGIPAVVSTDAFVQSYRPMDAIYGAVIRKSWNGEDLGQQEAISVYEAVKAYTINAAHSVFQEDVKGSIEAGKCADLALIGADLLNCAVDDIPSLSVEMTLVDGDIRHQIEK